MFNPFLSEVEPQAMPQYGNPVVTEAAIASNPFLSGGAFSYEPAPAVPQTSQGENPFLSSSNAVPAYAAGNPFADFVTPQPIGVGFIGATDTGVNSWNDMQTSYGSVSELEFQPVSTATQDLLFTVTGALEATSDSLLDRLRYAQPSPVPLPPSPTPSPRTPSPDLLMGDEDLTPMQPMNISKPMENTTTIDLMGLYNTAPEIKNTAAAESGIFASDFQQQMAMNFSNMQAFGDIMDLKLDAPQCVINSSPELTPIIETQPQAVQQVVPQAVPQVMTQSVPQVMTQSVPQVMPQAVPQVIPQAVPQVIPQAVPQVIPQAVPQVIPQAVPQVMPQVMPQPQMAPQVVEIVKQVEANTPKQEVTKIPERPPPARPTQPPKASPSRPPPPVPPSPRKEPIIQAVSQPVVESAPAHEQYAEVPDASSYFRSPPVLFYDTGPEPPTINVAPVPCPPPPSPRGGPSPFANTDTFTASNFAELSKGSRGVPPPVPPVPPAPRVFPSSPQPVTIVPPQKVDFDSFEDRFNNVPEGDGFEQTNAFGGFPDSGTTTSSAWGDGGSGGGGDGFGDSAGGFGDSEGGFGADKFDEFLSLREPPPVPQSTPAKSRLNSGSDDFDRAETNISITIRQKDKIDFSLDLVPSLAPPPKSPAISTGSAFSEDNSSFVPFLSSVKVSATGDGGSQVPRSDSQDSPQTPLFEEDQSVPLEDFPRINFTGDGWEMQMRHPNKKKITGQRFWKKVYVRLVSQTEIPTVQIFNTNKDKDPIQEIPLQPCYSVSDIAAQQFDQFGKIFTVKLQYIFYKERPGVRPGQITKAERITNKLSQFAAYAIQGDYQGVKEFGSDLKKLGLPLEHAPQLSQLVKLGTQNYEEMKQFSMIIEEALFRLPVHRDRALTYKSEEVQVTLVDEYYVEQDVHGVVTRQIARVRLHFLCFLSGSTEVELGINDIRRQGKEVVGRHDIIPIATEEWIRIEDIEFSSCVQLNVFDDTKMVKFKPPDACYIELLRFRVRPPRHRELPLQVKTVFTTTGHRIEIRCDILVPGFTSRKLGQIPCEDVMIRIPIPECWIYMFRVEKHFRYGSVKSAHRRSGKVKGIERFLGAVEAVENSLMEVTSGQAKYEHQHKAIVWRVSRLPKEGQGAYTTHSFFCHITLQPHEEIPVNLTKHCYVEFTMPHTTISHTVCRSVSVPMCDEPPEKCVKYLSRHEYIVEIEHTQGVTPATYNLAATVVKEEAPQVKPEAEEPMEGKALSDSDFSDD